MDIHPQGGQGMIVRTPEIGWGHMVENLQRQDKFTLLSVGGRKQLTVCLAGGGHFTYIY